MFLIKSFVKLHINKIIKLLIFIINQTGIVIFPFPLLLM